MGLDVDTWDVDHAAIARLPGYGPVEWSYEGRPNVAARWPAAGEGGRSLVLQSHVDVVPATPEGRWTHPPWGGEIADGRMWGRGAADMKSGIAAMVYAVRALRDAGARAGRRPEPRDRDRGGVHGQRRAGGARPRLHRRRGDHPRAARPDRAGGPGGRHLGRIAVHGQGAHAERASAAQNAVVKAARVIEAVRELEARANRERERPPQFADHEHPLNYNVGVIRGGDWTSSVPEECVLEVRLGLFPGEDMRAIQDAFRDELLAELADDPWLAEHPPDVTFYAFQADGCVVPRDTPIVGALARTHRELTGAELELLSFTGTTDARFFNLFYDTPCTCYGAVGGNLHAPDEWVDLESVREVTKVLALTAIDWCG